MKTIGECIQTARTQRGFSQKKLAELAGLSATSVWYYENNLCMPNAVYLISIADALEMSMDDLVDRKIPKRKVITNADKIRSMTDEELAELLEGPYGNIEIGKALNWLKQPAKED